MIKGLLDIITGASQHPGAMKKLVRMLPLVQRGRSYASNWQSSTSSRRITEGRPNNPLKSYFDSYHEGPGISKWMHYFDIYHRHFSKFVGRELHILEIGVYSGGSLRMWRDYFGTKCYVHGVDIEKACKVYENDYTTIDIGDQADRTFWKRFKEMNPVIDVVIDDGGHMPQQQMVTLEEMLPHLQPGGVFLCEDVHGEYDMFTPFVQGLAANLNCFEKTPAPSSSQPDSTPHPPVLCCPTHFQMEVQSVHFYPFVTVIEKADPQVRQFTASERGTQWQPFLG
jgi:hypothetical protein